MVHALSIMLLTAARVVAAGVWVWTRSAKHTSSVMLVIFVARHCALVDGGSSNMNMFTKK